MIFEVHHLAVLMDPDTLHVGHAGHTPHEARRVDERDPLPIKKAREIGLRVDHPGYGLAVEELSDNSQRTHVVHGATQFLDLVGSNGDSDLPRPPEITVDSVERHESLDVVEIAHTQIQKCGHLVGPPGEAISEPVREARRHEPTITPGATVTDSPRLENHHIGPQITIVGEKRAPDSRETAADNNQVRGRLAGEVRAWFGSMGAIEPVDPTLNIP
jgi:hypothetical protein